MSPKPPKKRHSSKKRKRRRSPESAAAASLKLLEHAATGRTRRVRKLLDGGGRRSVNAFDAEGLTPLHHACRHGHLDTATLLLRRGADIDAEDVAGNSPAHLAAAGGHLALLSALLQMEPPPNIDRRNARGVTVRSLAAALMSRDDIDDWRSGQPQHSSSPAPEPSSEEGETPEATWRRRLAAEAAADGGEPSFAAGGWGDPNWAEEAEPDDPGVPWGGASETEEQFAARIWAAMERRKHADFEAASAAYNKEREAAAERRRAAEADAFARSRKILEEELARDRAWRDAVKQGDVGVRRARYEARWHAFAAAAKAAAAADVAYGQVPWIVEAETGNIQPIVFYGVSGKDEKRKRLRVELMRWHPDKFEARFGRRLATADREKILDRVKGVSQALNALAAE